MSYCRIKEFRTELICCKEKDFVWGKSFNLQRYHEIITEQVKNYFPLNGVPENIVDCLTILEDNLSSVQESIIFTMDRILNQIEKDLPVEKDLPERDYP